MTGPTRDTASAVASVAAFGLSGSRLDLPEATLSPHAWAELVQRCRAERLMPFLSAAVRARVLPATREQAAALEAFDVESTRSALVLEQRVAALSGLLRSAHIGHRVVDGPARAHVAYPALELSSFDTVSIVVAPARLNEARGLAEQCSEFTVDRCTLPPPRLMVRTAFWTRPGGVPVGLDDLTGAASVIDLAGRDVAVLSAEEQLLGACADLASARGQHELVRRRDIASLVLTAPLDPGRVRSLAARWQVTEPVAWGIDDTWRTFDLADKTELSVWAQRLRVPAPAAATGAADASKQPSARGSRGRMPRMLRRHHHPVAKATATRRHL